jgi:hypothetical protein
VRIPTYHCSPNYEDICGQRHDHKQRSAAVWPGDRHCRARNRVDILAHVCLRPREQYSAVCPLEEAACCRSTLCLDATHAHVAELAPDNAQAVPDLEAEELRDLRRVAEHSTLGNEQALR